MRFGLVLSAAFLSVLLVTFAAQPAPPAAGAPGAPGAGKKCKKRRVPLKINGRRRCVRLKAAIPRPRAADPRLLAARAALKLDLSRFRDRRGRRVVSAGKLLGKRRTRTAQRAIKKGLATLDRLRARAAVASISRLPLGADSAGGCGGGGGGHPELTKGFKGNGFDAKVELDKGAAQIGVDLGEGGIRAEIDLGLCDQGESKLKLPQCPDREGRLEGSDASLYYFSLRIFRGAELLLSQSGRFSSKTSIEPIQVDDDAKLEFFEIDHTYRTSVEVGGSSQVFSRINLKLTYHGHTRVNYPGATYDPTSTDVEANLEVDGVDDAHEIREAEFDQSLKAKKEADRTFAAEVDKVIKSLDQREKGWNTPNACAEVSFEPVSESVILKRNDSGPLKALVVSKKGGSPSSGKWTVLDRQNATLGPDAALANPATFTYTVTNAGPGLLVSGTFRAVSRVGVAEGTWVEKTTDKAPPPPVIEGSFVGTADYDAAELGSGNELHAEWKGAVLLSESPPLYPPGTPGAPAATYQLTAGGMEYTYMGHIDGCTVYPPLFAGVDFAKQPDLKDLVVLWVYDESQREYQFLIPMPLLVKVQGIKHNCDEPSEDGEPFEWFLATGLPWVAYGPLPGGPVDPDWTMVRKWEAAGAPGSPDQTWGWILGPSP
jgi:hypothetical protein